MAAAKSFSSASLLAVLVLAVLTAFQTGYTKGVSDTSGEQQIRLTLAASDQDAALRGVVSSATADCSGEKDFLTIAKQTGTDKVLGHGTLEACLKDESKCTTCPGCVREECRPWGHFYDTMYQNRLAKYSRDNLEPFQFLEIGFYTGKGFEAYMEFLPRAEAHTIEISCRGFDYPYENAAAKNEKWYSVLRQKNRLHCGDANDVDFLNKTWKTHMKRPDAPPLTIVVDDASHDARHMAQSVFFWFPRIAPRGLMIVEDIQPINGPNKFRTQFLPQIMWDLHFCGDPKLPDEACFPTLQPLLASIHCEMHICVFERNDVPAVEKSLEDSRMPPGALDLTTCKSFKS